MAVLIVFFVIIPAFVVIAYELYDHEHDAKIEKFLEAFKEFEESADNYNKKLEDLDN
tara:strand:- start:302 stop:472 length:171 start_codon:yes stop_codon:yes gene_type:complete